jgi:hypothetical protein
MFSSISSNNFIEIDFIDGVSEFLNLVKVDSERTNEIAAQNNIVQFQLAASSLYYEALGVKFEDTSTFIALKTVPINSSNQHGDYMIYANGYVEVYIDDQYLLPDTSYSYYYLDSGIPIKNRFSVDYDQSVIYFSESVSDSSAVIKYKIANYIAEYDILSKVEDFTVNYKNKEVRINSSDFPVSRGNLYLFYKKSLSGYNLENVQEFFSPLLYGLRYEFK